LTGLTGVSRCADFFSGSIRFGRVRGLGDG
jgi:hypothetical protein